MGLWVYLGLYFTEKYPKVPCQLLVKLALVKDNDWLGLDEAIIIAGEEVPYQSMSIPLVSQTSLRMRNPLPFTKEYISPFSSVSQSPSQVSSLGNYSPLSLPTLSYVLCPFTPIEDDPEGDVVYMGKHDAAPNSSQVDFKPDICFFYLCSLLLNHTETTSILDMVLHPSLGQMTLYCVTKQTGGF